MGTYANAKQAIAAQSRQENAAARRNLPKITTLAEFKAAAEKIGAMVEKDSTDEKVRVRSIAGRHGKFIQEQCQLMLTGIFTKFTHMVGGRGEGRYYLLIATDGDLVESGDYSETHDRLTVTWGKGLRFSAGRWESFRAVGLTKAQFKTCMEFVKSAKSYGAAFKQLAANPQKILPGLVS